MARLWPGSFAVLVALAMLPSAAHAQARTCDQELPSDIRRIVNAQGQEIVYFRDPVRFLCSGNVRLESDSAVVNRASSSFELIGRVVYRDSTRELRSEWANYIGRVDQLLARDAVVLRDLEGGAVIRGDQLNYLRDTPDRPVARMIVTGERPSAVIPRRPDTAGGPMRVEADRLELEGEDLSRARGNVDLERGEMLGAGETAVFDQAAERMTLTGSASVWNESYRLDGQRIEAVLEGEGLREVRAEIAARLTSEELSVFSDQIRIGFLNGELERLEAWNPGSTDGGPRARAEARDFRLRADSIDARADSVGIRELRAVGRAYGERDIAANPGGTTAAMPAAIARDWIQGDTILGFFTHAPIPPDTTDAPDTAALTLDAPEATETDSTRAVLERIVAVGGAEPALSLYRMAADESGQVAMNFMKASRIIFFMEQGDLERVEAEGPVEGVYLDPIRGGAEGGEGR